MKVESTGRETVKVEEMVVRAEHDAVLRLISELSKDPRVLGAVVVVARVTAVSDSAVDTDAEARAFVAAELGDDLADDVRRLLLGGALTAIKQTVPVE